MSTLNVKQNINVQVPVSIAKDLSDEILSLYQDKVLTKIEFYRSRLRQMESKYKMTFQEFKKRVDESEDEAFSDWDDLILWEGYHLGFQEWSNKNRDILECMK